MKQDIFESGAIYHIFNRGNNKENIFIEEKNYYYFLQQLKKYILPIADVYAYCLLKNHFHLLLRIKDEKYLPEKVKNKLHQPFSNLFNSYSKSINKMYGRTGSLFEEHLKRKRVENVEYLIQLVAYIHLNPVKHKFIDNYRDYKFSSFQAYISDKPTEIDKDFILSQIEKDSFLYWHDLKRIELEEIKLFFNEDD